MVDVSKLAWRRQKDLCSMYDASKSGPFEIFSVNGAKGNSKIVAVFRTYKLPLPWENGRKGGNPSEDEHSVGEVDAEDVVDLSSDGSQGDNTFMDEPPMKRGKAMGKSASAQKSKEDNPSQHRDNRAF
ncbi:hypothetical protein M758_UG317700 [Ceratodon purpureus]|nr:hypothetical protein M758_UG317700 [Ceratodon purpureus]